jgi:ribosome biogenesis GTPase
MRPVRVLEALGWDDGWAASFEPYREAQLAPGRVAVQHRGAYDVLTESGELRVRVADRLRRDAASPAELPVVGDWVAVDPETRTIHAVLARRTSFSRRAPSDGPEGIREQVVTANLDLVFVVSAFGDELSVPLLERYLTLAWESGARPVILLTKADLESSPDAIAAEVAATGGEVPVVAVSARTGTGLETLRSYLPPGATGALLGPSGAGKSTLVNALVGEELVTTAPLRARGGGRHTTTRRQLVALPDGGLLIDNPGMRDVQLWLSDQGLEDAFPEIGELEGQCRFADCSHESEPGCAVRAAIADGRLPAERWERYRGLRRELAELEERLARRERSRARRRAPDTGGS